MTKFVVKSINLMLFSLLIVADLANAQAVRVQETTITIPTYLIGEPEPNPIFYTPEGYQLAQMHIYPYPYLGFLTDEKAEQPYQALFLENEYLQICVLPELGGRIYIARDKTNEYDFFYYNQVIKPALIGMVGAWLSGGVEWNIPHHHRASTFMPVDYKLEARDDGSKTIWVGEYEKRHGTRWAVGLTLYPGRAYVETTMKHFNPTPLAQSILMWANTAVHANENYQVFFPPDVERAVFHGKFEFTDWPIARQFYRGIDFTAGVDVSWWKNIFAPTSFFAWDTKMDFLAGIDHGKQAGTVLVGNHHLFPGKKVWYWGNNDIQRLWDQMLTDSDGPYLELMMGLYSDSQPDYSWNSPYSTKYGTMYFYPIKNLTAIKNASKDFAISLVEQDRVATIEIYATAPVSGLKVVLSDPKETLFTETVELSPLDTYRKQVTLARDYTPGELILALVDQAGNELIVYSAEARKDKPLPEVYQDPEAPETYLFADELFLVALRLEQYGHPRFAPLKYYLEALKREPNHILANTHLGIWYLKKGLNQLAEERLRVAVNQVTGNYTRAKYDESLYYLGVALYNQQRWEEAYDVLYLATWNEEWASAAYYLLALIDCRRGNIDPAGAALDRAIAANSNNTEAQVLKAVLLRKHNQIEACNQQIERVLAFDPLHLTALNESYLLAKITRQHSETALADLLAHFRDEPDNYLETAARYGAAGFFQDAIDLLSIAATCDLKQLKNNPMIFYYLGYFYQQLGQSEKARKHFQQTATLLTDLCFPYGQTSKIVLEAAIKHNPTDATAHYLAGNVYADNDPGRAIEMWEKSVALNDKMAMGYRNLAFLQANIFDELPPALANIEKSIRLNPDDPRRLFEADIYAAYARISPAERLALLEKHSRTVAKWDKLALRRISLRNFFGQYERTIPELKNRHFYVAEITHINPHIEWTNAHLYRGIQALAKGDHAAALADFNAILEFPRNLEIARDTKTGTAHFWIGKTYELLKQPAQAHEAYQKMVAFKSGQGWGAYATPLIRFYAALALQALGETSTADEVFHALLVDGRHSLDETAPTGLDLKGVRVRQDLRNNRAEAYFSMALGHLGKGDESSAKTAFQQVLVINPAHIDAHNLLNNRELLGLIGRE